MKKLFLLSALMICNSSFAETVRVNIASKAYPDGMSAEQYQQRLILQNTQYTITVPDTKAAANEASTEAAQKKVQVKTDAANATREYRKKVERNWNAPAGKSGEKAILSVTLNVDGSVRHVTVLASDPAVKTSAEKAVYAATPYPIPSDPEVRRLTLDFRIVLTVK